MNHINSELNLARKWRPKQFNQVIGQDFSVRILKNGLYLNKVFPVYIFCGQRGCGKTSTARIFAAALNCEKLNSFRKNPKDIDIPCLECESCKWMQKASHPDFIEIDAASNTGVDNVRQIIESAAHMPISGSNKVYLIDEAHMLSKAAFNAFLKILEEPPLGVHFILATTDLTKIPDTVKSRAFLVFFNSVDNKILVSHLKMICEHENVSIDDEALELIVEESQGTIRDSQNLLERVRFLGNRVTKNLVLSLIGRLNEESLIKVFELALNRQPSQLLSYLNLISFNKLAPEAVWSDLIDVCRILIWIKYKVDHIPPTFKTQKNKLLELANKCSINRLNSILQLFWLQEETFFRTSKKHAFLEIILLNISNQVNVSDLEDLIKGVDDFSNNYINNDQEDIVVDLVGSNQASNEVYETINKEEKVIISEQVIDTSKLNSNSLEAAKWNEVVKKVSNLKNLMLESIFRQIQFVSLDREKNIIKVSLKNKNKFFEDTLLEFKDKVASLLKEVFEQDLSMEFINSSEGSTELVESTPKKQLKSLEIRSFNPVGGNTYSQPIKDNLVRPSRTKEVIDVSDSDKWPQAYLLTKYFSGRIESSSEN